MINLGRTIIRRLPNRTPYLSFSRSHTGSTYRGGNPKSIFYGLLWAVPVLASAYYFRPRNFCDKEHAHSQDDSWSVDSWKKRKIGLYENRLRAFAHPYKVFSYFASVPRNGKYYMTAEDFIRSLVPYRDVPSSDMPDERYRRLKAQSAVQLFKLADMNSDGLIDFQEYMFFLLLLTTPEHHFEIAFKIFDEDGNGSIDWNEFTKVMDITHDDADIPLFGRLGNREQSSLSVKKCSGLLSLFFNEGDKKLTYDEFYGFMKRLRLEVLKLEFYNYKVDDGDTISMKDFAYALVSYVDHKKLEELQAKIHQMPSYSERIAFHQFIEFDNVIKKIDDVTMALGIYTEGEGRFDSGGMFTKDDLRRAIRAATNYDLTPAQLDVLFYVFDHDGAGKLNYSSFVEVIKSRYSKGLDMHRDTGFIRYMHKVWDCAQRT